MSVITEHGRKIVLQRVGPNPFWQRIRECRGHDRRAWRRYVMLALREGHDWPVEWIAEAFFLHKGTASRHIRRALLELRTLLDEEELRGGGRGDREK